MAEAKTWAWRPHAGPQTEFCRRGEFEVLFGGAAGPGKTDCLVMLATRYVWNPGYKGVIFRRTFPQLQEIMDRCRTYYPKIDPGCEFRAAEHRWHFSSGAIVRLSHLQHEDDRYNHQGAEYQFVGFDELTQFSLNQYLYLFSRTRSVDPRMRPIVRATTNPGGVGHSWVRDRFITITDPKKTYIDPSTGFSRAYIPARIADNPTLIQNDPAYVKRLMLLPEIERMRLLEGLWDVFEGQAFPELSKEIHGIKPFEIPPEWERFRAFDWGYSRPYSVGWYCVDFEGNLYRYRELYGRRKDADENTGVKKTATDIAREIREIEFNEKDGKVRAGPADPSIWSKRITKDGKNMGISVAEEMAAAGVVWLKADNNRVLGRQQVHERLKLNDEGLPRVKVFTTCENFWRTMPLMTEDVKNPEDVNSDLEDHAYDEFRYACMHRPIRPVKRKWEPGPGTFAYERRKYMRARDYAERHGVSLTDAYSMVRG